MVRTESVDVKGLKTRPPARYTEATLLGAMEGAGKLIDDDELREAMQEKGLGTPATRAAIIEGLIYEKYMPPRRPRAGARRQGLPADDAAARPRRGRPDQARAHRQLGIPARARWRRASSARDAFMREIAEMAERIVRKAKEYDRDTIPGDYATLDDAVPELRRRRQGELPPLRLHRQAGRASRAAFRSARSRRAARSSWPRSRRSCATSGSARSRASARRPAGRSRPSSKLGFDEEAKNWKLEFDFGEDAKREDAASRSISATRNRSASARSAAASVFEFGSNYVCEHAVPTRAHVTCDFKSGKVILQQPVAREQMTKLLATGRTELLEGSSRTRRGASSRRAWPGTRRKAR